MANLTAYLQVGGYATRAVLPEASVIPIRKDAPLDVVSLVSCGVLAGAGPVINMDGRYKLRELISRRVPLGEVNQAYEALLQGEVKRSVVVFE